MHHYSTDDECKETCIVQGQQDIRGGSITTTPRCRVQSTGKTSSRKKSIRVSSIIAQFPYRIYEYYSRPPFPYKYKVSYKDCPLLTTKKHNPTQQHSQTTITTNQELRKKNNYDLRQSKDFFTPCNPSPENNIITIQNHQQLDHVLQQQQQQQRTHHPPTTPNLPPSFSATTNANAILASRAATTRSHGWRLPRRR